MIEHQHPFSRAYFEGEGYAGLYRDFPAHYKTAENTIQVLKQAIAKYGRPQEILTDRGSQFYANEGERKEKGISRFERYLADKGIKHILCRVNRPQTNGKLERFCGVYEQKQHQFKSIDGYTRWHNETKTHLSFNIETFETPIQACHRKLPLEKTEKTETTEPLVEQ
ncbi:transposase family protein [Candidatus Bathyarchaeota archaeon]|nr:transposase family protein [Candidatus Bathyarchaeota archaeon]